MEERPKLIGRVDVRRRVGEHLSAGSVLLHGPPGIGKSTLATAVAVDLAGRGDRVMCTSPGPSESALPYLALIDLLGPVLPEARGVLPAHLLAALEIALMRREAGESPHDQLAVRLAVLELLRALAAERRILIVLDDVQWVDQPSAELLAFAARRLPASRVRVLAAERIAQGEEPSRQALCPQPLLDLPLAALTEPELAELLRARLGTAYPRGALRRVHEASGGNPYFALELGRALAQRGPLGPAEPLPVPDRLRALLVERLNALAEPVRRALLLIAAAARPSRALPAACGVEAEVAVAAEAGVLARSNDDVIRFSHPLLRELVYADASTPDRIAAHAALAEHAREPVERARHLALAAPHADEQLAATLDRAADAAAARGAPSIAAELSRLAAERTLETNVEQVAARMLQTAQHAYNAGLSEEARLAAMAALSPEAPRTTRVAARLLLFVLTGQDKSDTGPLLEAAFADAMGDPELEAAVRVRRAEKVYYDGDIVSADAELEVAERLAEQCGNVELLIDATALRGVAKSTLGDPAADEMQEKAWRLAISMPLSSAVVQSRQLWAMTLLFRGDVAGALREIEPLWAEVQQAGMQREVAWVLVSLTSIYMRVGRGVEALAMGRRCAELFEDIDCTPGPGLVVGSGAEFYAGSAQAAIRYADAAVAACDAAGDEEWLSVAFSARGQAALLAGDAAEAAELMRRALRMERKQRQIDPAVVPWHADFVEALITVGARDEALSVISEIRGYADQFQRRVVLLNLARVEALARAARGDTRGAADDLRATLDKHTDHPYPLDIARCYLALGVLERRAHRRSAAREALAEAEGRFAEVGAKPWVAVTRAELSRLDGGRADGPLSDTEQRIVELVKGGATNREIAGTLFLSVKAVEANLTRLYRRLGVRNRTQLVRALDREGRQEGHPG
ncbi:MAG: AAA family ATPase [Micromonosporaceae bacterium]